MIRQVSSQLADFLGLGPTPASSDEVVVRLLTEMLEVRILPGEPKFFCIKQLQSLGRAFGSRPNAWAF